MLKKGRQRPQARIRLTPAVVDRELPDCHCDCTGRGRLRYSAAGHAVSQMQQSVYRIHPRTMDESHVLKSMDECVKGFTRVFVLEIKLVARYGFNERAHVLTHGLDDPVQDNGEKPKGEPETDRFKSSRSLYSATALKKLSPELMVTSDPLISGSSRSARSSSNA